MENVNYSNIANNLLGDELYQLFIKEISKENEGLDLVDFGKEVVDKCCFLIIMIGMSKKVNLDNVKICLGDQVIPISCKKFARKYEKYSRKIEENVLDTIKLINKQ